jgi:uncharacterized protein (DUF4415 family)
MSEDTITRVSLRDRRAGRTNLERLRTISDEEIEAAVATDPDAAPLDLDWSKAEVVTPPRKRPISIRVDEDVLEFFKRQGAGYQRRMNAVLRAYMTAAINPKLKRKRS